MGASRKNHTQSLYHLSVPFNTLKEEIKRTKAYQLLTSIFEEEYLLCASPFFCNCLPERHLHWTTGISSIKNSFLFLEFALELIVITCGWEIFVLTFLQCRKNTNTFMLRSVGQWASSTWRIISKLRTKIGSITMETKCTSYFDEGEGRNPYKQYLN